MKVLVMGLRGLPGVQGGVETHTEQLYPRLAALGCEVEVVVRSPFSAPGVRRFGALSIRRLWSPRYSGIEALVHSVMAVLYAAIRRPDILHIHAIGPAIVTPVARLLGLRVVVTHHGHDYDREKWGPFARMILRTGERWGMRYSNARISVSQGIADKVATLYGRQCTVIPNGVLPPPTGLGDSAPAEFGLAPGRYFLQVSRLVPEKRQLDLIQAYARLGPVPWKLALVGGLGDDPYCRTLREAAAQVPGVVLTGFQTGARLQELYRHAGSFVLPSSHEGLPIAILEALGHGVPVIASNIAPNTEIGLPAECYFPVGDVAALSGRLRAALEAPPLQDDARAALQAWALERYDWDRIAQRTLRVFSGLGGAP
jgi:glycosyltransferase involved in cell wall biosynthesis